MQAADDPFDLVLSYPQWQGSGRPEHLRRGAKAAAEVCGNYGPLVRIAEAGEGEASGGIRRWTAIIEQFRSARTILDAKQPRRILTVGGDCACDIAVIDYLHRRYPDLTVIWVDAHLDANTVDTTPSGHFHGMPVAAILGSAPPGLQALLSTPLPPAQRCYALGQAVGLHQRRVADLEADGRLTGDGEQFTVAPHGAGATLDGVAGEGLFRALVVVHDFQRAEIELANVGGRQRVFPAALAALESLHETIGLFHNFVVPLRRRGNKKPLLIE